MNNLGYKGRDEITGFSGVITAYVEYITGCHQYLLAPACKEDGTLVGSEWFDVGRVRVFRDTRIKLASSESVDRPGFGREAPKR